MAVAEDKEVTPREFQKAWNDKRKQIDAELKGESTKYADQLEKYHIAGQHGMSAPKPPKGKDINVVALRSQLEGGSVKDTDVVTQYPADGRISPEEAIHIAREGTDKPLGVGGFYHAISKREDDEEGKPSKPVATPVPAKTHSNK